ncbi:MAG TPA: glycoside hydrolase family 76 protein [Solirubrobacteraceae bacterium]|nr:glycoside hydrolase family 76 protein [Solirubrobacteraceae bacterium]
MSVRRHPLLSGAILGVVVVLALGAAAWRLGYVRLQSPGIAPAAPAHPLAVHRLAALVHPPAVSAGGDPLPRRRVLLATESALRELSGSGSNSTVSWDSSTGLWDYAPVKEERATGKGRTPTWWQSALALDAVVRAVTTLHSADPYYQQLLQTTYARNVSKPGTYAPQDFENNYMDDTAWWGIAWLHAAQYELRVLHDSSAASTYLTVAEDDARYLDEQPKRCGAASIPFKDGYAPNTITDAEYIDLVAQLGQIRSGHGPLADPALASRWRAAALRTLGWLESSGLVNMRTGAVHRTQDNHCRAVGPAQTYTEGEVSDALTQVGLLTHDRSYVNQAAVFINRVLEPRHGMLAAGIVQEPCEGQTHLCLGKSYNITVFKGLFDNAVADWSAATGSGAYEPFLAAQAQAIIHNATGRESGACTSPGTCQLSMYWARLVPQAHQPIVPTPGSQASGLSALVNALRPEND